jgi:phospholysine phosphohistidine inorganic pyrophosphate phosphatase
MLAVLFDMDGVVYNSDEPIPGAAETLRWVRDRKIPHLFVTNTSSRSRAALADKLSKFGIPADPEEVLTPAAAAAAWLRTRTDGPAALFVKPAARVEFEGISHVADDAEKGARYVVIGDLAENWDFRTLNRAFRLLHSDPEATLVALGMTRIWQAPDGLRLDVAPFVAALEHATRRTPMNFGKPEAPFFDAAARKLGLPAGEVLMIGDDIEVDVGGAQRAGMKGALVKTGKFRPADLHGAIQPDVVLESIADLPLCWERLH